MGFVCCQVQESRCTVARSNIHFILLVTSRVNQGLTHHQVLTACVPPGFLRDNPEVTIYFYGLHER